MGTLGGYFLWLMKAEFTGAPQLKSWASGCCSKSSPVPQLMFWLLFSLSSTVPVLALHPVANIDPNHWSWLFMPCSLSLKKSSESGLSIPGLLLLFSQPIVILSQPWRVKTYMQISALLFLAQPGTFLCCPSWFSPPTFSPAYCT